MDPTVFRLFAEGAHHVVSSLVGFARDLLASSFLALQRRFSWLGDRDLPAVATLVREVNRAVTAGEALGISSSSTPMSYGINPAIPDNYQYSVIAYLPNPAEPDRQTTIPWTINSQVPLSYLEVLEQAENELNQAFDRGDKYMKAEYAELHRRDIAFQRIVQDEYGGHAPIDIVIRSIYRQQ